MSPVSLSSAPDARPSPASAWFSSLFRRTAFGRLEATVRLLGLVVGLAVALAIPGLYTAVSYDDTIRQMEFKAGIAADRLVRLAERNGPDWLADAERIQAALTFPAGEQPRRVAVFTPNGDLVTASGVPAGILRQQAVLADGATIAVIEVAEDAGPLLTGAAIAAAAGVLLGLLVCLVLYLLPLRALDHALAELAATQNALEQERAAALAKQETDAATEAKSRFLALMSHELRTPMNGVLGALELLGDSGLDREQAGYLRSARQSAEGLLGLIEDILDFSHMQAGNLKLRPVPFGPTEIVTAVARSVAPLACDKDIRVECQLSAHLPEQVMGDPARLRQVLLNLAHNAVKFTESGHIVIAAAPHDTALRFSVSDTGQGIADRDRDRLFGEFGQLDASDTRRHGGTGLGLAICKRVVEAMGGRLGVESRPAEGSTFWFEVPLPAAEATQPAPAAAAANDCSGSRGRLLIAEDSRVNQTVLALLLRKAGYDVSVASDGLAALQAAERQRFDLVLMDMQMPEMDGLLATRLIRALPDGAGSMPIVALTAGAMADDRERCAAVGMDDYMTKPIRRDELLKLVATWVGRSHRPMAAKPAA